MAFWNRKHRRFPASLTVHNGEVAAVRRYDLHNPADVDALVKSQQQWQSDAWIYADLVGEAKDAVRFVENCFRRIPLTVGFQREPDAEPIDVMDARAPKDGGPDRKPDAETIDAADYVPDAVAEQAQDIIRSFAARDGGQPLLMGKLGINIFLVGEAVIVNREVIARRPTNSETPADVEKILDWEVRSRDEVRRSQQAGVEVELVDSPDQQTGVPLPDDAYIERIWRRHGRWSAWADSNFRAAIGTLEELDLLARLARGSIRTRLLAGVLVIADELDFGDADQPREGQATKPGGKFDRDIAEALGSVIGNEADANGAIPLAFRGPKDLIDPDHFRVVEFPRRYQKEDREQYEDAVRRLGRTIELPVEHTTGIGDVNHWTAWQIDEDTYEAYIEPLVGVATEGLTFGLLRPMLLDANVSEDIVSRLVVMADQSHLIRRPDRGKVATEGYGLDVPALSGEAWRKANGFGDDDAPDEEELLRHLVFKNGIDQALAIKVLSALGILPEELAAELEAERQAMADAISGQGGGSPSGAEPSGDPGGGNPGGGATPIRPETPPAAAAASIEPTQDRVVGDMLGSADRVLAERLLVAADAAMGRALEKVAARLRSQARAKPDRFGFQHTSAAAARSLVDRALANVPHLGVAVALGEAAVAAVQTDEELWADTFSELAVPWSAWVESTQRFALGTLAGYGLSEALQEEARQQQGRDRDDAWAWLLAALIAEAQAAASRGSTVEVPDDGEFDTTLLLAPAVIREALARAGGVGLVDRSRMGGITNANGDPVGGVATGPLIQRYFAAAGFPWSGYRWEYGDSSLRQRPYEPHRALAGLTFERWDDGTLATPGGAWPGVTSYYPGDHRHCRCSFTPIIEQAPA